MPRIRIYKCIGCGMPVIRPGANIHHIPEDIRIMLAGVKTPAGVACLDHAKRFQRGKKHHPKGPGAYHFKHSDEYKRHVESGPTPDWLREQIDAEWRKANPRYYKLDANGRMPSVGSSKSARPRKVNLTDAQKAALRCYLSGDRSPSVVAICDSLM